MGGIILRVYQKLVRDKIPAIIESVGDRPIYSILSKDDYIRELEHKLMEEVEEYQKDKNLEEMADVLEVLYALCKARGYTLEELECFRKTKYHDRGGFDLGIYLDKVEESRKESSMTYIYSNGKNQDFAYLCTLLDGVLNVSSGGEENRVEQAKYNGLEQIHDVVVVYEDSIAVACASFKFFDEESVELKRVYVKDDYRRKGIAREMIKQLEESARKQGYKRFVLETLDASVEAITLYSSIGYQRIANYGPYAKIESSICMEKFIV